MFSFVTSLTALLCLGSQILSADAYGTFCVLPDDFVDRNTEKSPHFHESIVNKNCISHFSCAIFPFAASSFVPRDYGVVSTPVKNVMNTYGRSSASSSRRNDIKMMPIGVPKVAYRVPGSQSADW
jgi:hypothetical protein